MKTLTVFTLLLISSSIPGMAQTLGSYNGWCQKGAVKVATSGQTSSNTVQGSFPSCTVTVFVTGSGGTLATLYSDQAGTGKANPFTANADGTYQFFIANLSQFDVRMSSGGIPSPFTLGSQAVAVPLAQTSTTPANNGAAQIGFRQSTSTVPRNVQTKLQEVVSAMDFGAVPDGATDNGAVMAGLITSFQGTSTCVRFPAPAGTTGVYNFQQPLTITASFCWIADPGVRLKYTGAGAITNAITWNCASNCYSGTFVGFILDGGTVTGIAQFGLQIKNVISSRINIRVTNVAHAGFHCGAGGFCQQLDFSGSSVSGNTEPFIRTPINGWLFEDGFTHSSNTMAVNIDHVSGDGTLANGGLVNTILTGYVSEGNGGCALKQAASATNPNLNNHLPGPGDVEVNAGGDICSSGGAAGTGGSTYTAMNAFSPAGSTFINSSDNIILGGSQGGNVSFDSSSVNNSVIGTHIYTVGSTVTAAFCNTILNVRNYSSGVYQNNQLCNMNGYHKFVGTGTAYARFGTVSGGSGESVMHTWFSSTLGVNAGVDGSLGKQYIAYNSANPLVVYMATGTDPLTGAVAVGEWNTAGGLSLGRFNTGNSDTLNASNLQAGGDTTWRGKAGSTQNAVPIFQLFKTDGVTNLIRISTFSGATLMAGSTFANLGNDNTNGTMVYCPDCVIANPCTGGGSGAFAKRLNSIWVCN